MGWVIALLAIGCVFFAAQVVVDYIRYRRAIEPRLEQAEAAKHTLKERIEAAEAELDQTRADLEPAREEVARLEKEYADLHGQVKDETARQRGLRNPPKA